MQFDKDSKMKDRSIFYIKIIIKILLKKKKKVLSQQLS